MTSLDLGCGYNEAHIRKGDVGIDLTKGLCDVQADAHHLPFKDASINSIRLHHVLEHLENPTKALKEAKRVLIAGGILDVRVPNPYTFWIVRNIIRKRKRSPNLFIDKTHLCCFGEQELVNLLTKIGFGQPAVTYIPDIHIKPKYRLLKRLFYKVLYRYFPAFRMAIRVVSVNPTSK